MENVLETTWKFIVMNLIWIPLHVAWLALGSTIERINLNMGYKAVNNIQIMQTNLTNNKNQNKKKFEKDLISTKEHLEMEKIMNNVENERIREKLISLSKTIFVKKENE